MGFVITGNANAVCKAASAGVQFLRTGDSESVHTVWALVATITARLRGFCLYRDEYLCRPVTKHDAIEIAAAAGGAPVTTQR